MKKKTIVSKKLKIANRRKRVLPSFAPIGAMFAEFVAASAAFWGSQHYRNVVSSRRRRRGHRCYHCGDVIKESGWGAALPSDASWLRVKKMIQSCFVTNGVSVSRITHQAYPAECQCVFSRIIKPVKLTASHFGWRQAPPE